MAAAVAVDGTEGSASGPHWRRVVVGGGDETHPWHNGQTFGSNRLRPGRRSLSPSHSRHAAECDWPLPTSSVVSPSLDLAPDARTTRVRGMGGGHALPVVARVRGGATARRARRRCLRSDILASWHERNSLKPTLTPMIVDYLPRLTLTGSTQPAASHAAVSRSTTASPAASGGGRIWRTRRLP
jgi:hypothetical protein